ncbi:NifB/NifX family molybdenum-iron cluster-binding protein [uncultured Thiohalocapsa sp.]|uniref:NifB/NifX family molybdenum-iron cluster-binding protein n=1 Tax=uncultured Thiohalocapsa sp. TaxID=768990 RepID=UPI0025DEC1E1|nr:NifB/NifX family molybdenum-iron cluster-binding protein [uncultured Thiohalocapsa sp.]
MRIAVSSQNFRSITGHAGKSRRFIVYNMEPGQAPVEVDRLDLPKEMSLHEYHGDDHPLFGLGLDAVLTGSAGAGFMQRLGRRGIRVIATAETDIDRALSALAKGESLPEAPPHDHGNGGGHGHGHGHGHGAGGGRHPMGAIH